MIHILIKGEKFLQLNYKIMFFTRTIFDDKFDIYP